MIGAVFFVAKLFILVNMRPTKEVPNLLRVKQHGINITMTATRLREQGVLAERDI